MESGEFDPQLGCQWGLGFLEASNVRVSGKLGLILLPLLQPKTKGGSTWIGLKMDNDPFFRDFWQ